MNTSNTSAHALLKDIWDDRKLPVNPVWIADELGLDVVETTLDDDVPGALLKEPKGDPVIILNRSDSNVRKRFTCAYELGHYVKRTESSQPLEYKLIDYHGGLTSQGVDSEEIFANNFAACLLMPEKKVWRLNNAGYASVMMASYFGVSDDAIHCRLENLGLRGVMTSRSYAISEKLKQAARRARGEPASGSSPSAKTLTHLSNKDPAKAHRRARTKDLKADTKLKKMFVRWFIGILIGQLLVMNGTFVLIGAELLHSSNFAINLFMGGALTEVLDIVLVMARYLFSKHV